MHRVSCAGAAASAAALRCLLLPLGITHGAKPLVFLRGSGQLHTIEVVPSHAARLIVTADHDLAGVVLNHLHLAGAVASVLGGDLLCRCRCGCLLQWGNRALAPPCRPRVVFVARVAGPSGDWVLPVGLFTPQE